jgi:hypothetical protein
MSQAELQGQTHYLCNIISYKTKLCNIIIKTISIKETYFSITIGSQLNPSNVKCVMAIRCMQEYIVASVINLFVDHVIEGNCYTHKLFSYYNYNSPYFFSLDYIYLMN